MLQQARENRQGDLDYTWLNVDQFIRMERKNISNQFSIHFRKNTRRYTNMRVLGICKRNWIE